MYVECLDVESLFIEYKRDEDVDEVLDKKLRILLSTCFTGEEDQIFKTQRYVRDVPQHRYLLWSTDNQLVGQVAVHEKALVSDGVPYAIGGISEVCVLPAYRQQGWVKQMLRRIHHDRQAAGDAFAFLFGSAQFYQGSEYRNADKLYMINRYGEWVPISDGMYVELNQPWPTGDVQLVGVPF
ncbi:GNAT family N-acetyltransferase [Photobacterium japonica]|uniref:GNAT family N-acetyltransferase n=1 Tax=Photobacterium japonica TaxID=2910235 RepID=UPI003D0982EC